MRLTEQQLKFIEAFGFLKFPGLLAAGMDGITDAFERVWADRDPRLSPGASRATHQARPYGNMVCHAENHAR